MGTGSSNMLTCFRVLLTKIHHLFGSLFVFAQIYSRGGSRPFVCGLSAPLLVILALLNSSQLYIDLFVTTQPQYQHWPQSDLSTQSDFSWFSFTFLFYYLTPFNSLTSCAQHIDAGVSLFRVVCCALMLSDVYTASWAYSIADKQLRQRVDSTD